MQTNFVRILSSRPRPASDIRTTVAKVITGTSAGALVAAFVCTHTDDELRRMLIPQLADRITACEESFTTWVPRWWKTGARFDTVQWARKSAFWTHGSMTFKEAYERTGRSVSGSITL